MKPNWRADSEAEEPMEMEDILSRPESAGDFLPVLSACWREGFWMGCVLGGIAGVVVALALVAGGIIR